MGRKSRTVPLGLGGKLKAVREHLDLSQTEMLRYVKPQEDKDHRAIISEYERGIKAPDYKALLLYARSVKISTDVLIDDALELSLEDGKGNSSTTATAADTADHYAESECLVIEFDSKLLDTIDNVFLELLLTTPRALRPHLSRSDFYRALVVSALKDYRDCPEKNRLIDAWRYMIKHVAAALDNNAA